MLCDSANITAASLLGVVFASRILIDEVPKGCDSAGALALGFRLVEKRFECLLIAIPASNAEDSLNIVTIWRLRTSPLVIFLERSLSRFFYIDRRYGELDCLLVFVSDLRNLEVSGLREVAFDYTNFRFPHLLRVGAFSLSTRYINTIAIAH